VGEKRGEHCRYGEKRGGNEGVGGLPNPKSWYIYDEHDIGPRYKFSRLDFRRRALYNNCLG